MSNFKEVKPEEFKINPFEKIGKEWMLITAGTEEKINTMTASWGGLGVMWGKNVAFIVIRPQRYTKEFIEQNETFSLTFYDPALKPKLGYLGKVSGRNEDKVEKSELLPAFEDKTPYFEEAETVIICKKLYKQDFQPECFLTQVESEKWYPEKDFHALYIAEVSKILTKA